MILTSTKVNIVCASRSVCPDIISEMLSLGFTDVDEVFNKVESDITARLCYDDIEEFDDKLAKLFSKNKEKIVQIGYTR